MCCSASTTEVPVQGEGERRCAAPHSKHELPTHICLLWRCSAGPLCAFCASVVTVADATSADDDAPLPTFDKFDDRGRHLSLIVVNANGAPVDPERFRERGGTVRTDEDGTWWVDFYLLPHGAELEPGTAYVAAEIHSHGPEHDETHWAFSFLQAPGGPVPAELKERAFAGAFPVNFKELLDLGDFKTSGEIAARASYLISEDRFGNALEDLGFFRTRKVGEAEMLVSSCTWEIYGLRSLVRMTLQTAPYEGAARLSARAELDVKLTPTVADDVDQMLWEEVTRCLSAEQNIATE